MRELVWLVGASAMSCLALGLLAGGGVGAEIVFGMAGPLAAVCASWIVIQRTHRTAPERVLPVMIAGFALKLVFFGVYVAVMVRVFGLRPVPFVVAFVSYLIALYAMQALFIRRLSVPAE